MCCKFLCTKKYKFWLIITGSKRIVKWCCSMYTFTRWMYRIAMFVYFLLWIAPYATARCNSSFAVNRVQPCVWILAHLCLDILIVIKFWWGLDIWIAHSSSSTYKQHAFQLCIFSFNFWIFVIPFVQWYVVYHSVHTKNQIFMFIFPILFKEASGRIQNANCCCTGLALKNICCDDISKTNLNAFWYSYSFVVARTLKVLWVDMTAMRETIFAKVTIQANI